MDGVRVSGIDAHCSVQVLWQYFDDKRGIVKAVYYPLQNNDAVVLFKHPSGTTDVLTRNHEKWKVSPLPNQVFSRVRACVESDLSVLVQATGAYQDCLRNMGHVDLTVDTKTQELVLSGQPYQIEWAWNYLSTLRDNQYHIARTLQTGEVNSSASRLSNGSPDPKHSTAYEHSHRYRSQSPRGSQDTRLQKGEKASTGHVTNVTSLQSDSLGIMHEPSPSSFDRYDSVLGGSRRQQKLQDEDALMSSLRHSRTAYEEQAHRQTLDARERRRRQDDANETFNTFASLPAGNSSAAVREPLRHTDPGRPSAGSKSVLDSTDQSPAELRGMEGAYEQERRFQSLNYRDPDDDLHVASGGYHSLQTDFARHREHEDAGDERRRTTSTAKRGTQDMADSFGASAVSPYALSAASVELSRKEFQVGKRLKLKIYMDDIIKTKTDAVVNAANWELKNIGGVAGALARAAGPEMAEECSKLVQKHGMLATAQVVKTKAYGNLAHLKCVIHTVGPIYIETDIERSVFELTQTFYNCLEFAEKQHLSSISFPFISTGIFGMPIEHCILALVTAVKLFADQQMGSEGHLEEIHFVNNDINVVCEAIIMTEQRLSMETVTSSRQRFEDGKKRFGRYVFPYCQRVSLAESERYATWDSSQPSHGVDREERSSGRSRFDQHAGAEEPWSLPQFGTKSDSRHRSGSLDRGSKTMTAGSSQPHSSQKPGARNPSPRPQARQRSNSLTLSGKPTSSKAPATTSPPQGSSGGKRQPVIKKSLTGSTSKSTGLAKRLASKKSAQSAGKSADYSGNDTDTASAAGSEIEDSDRGCLICMEPLRHPQTLSCGHTFCASCVQHASATRLHCPRCQRQTLSGFPGAKQPKDGTMSYTYSQHSELPGFEGSGTIVIKFVFPSGRQEAYHPNPGQPYEGIHSTAYLPDSVEGNEVLKLLKKAFDLGCLFTVSGRGTIITSDISLKSSKTGGPSKGGYPDPGYLTQVKRQVIAKGIISR